MKKITIFMFILCLGFYANARILYLNNNVETDASNRVFKTVAELMQFSGTSPNDTVYVTGSNKGYGNLTLTKKMVFIGPGNFLEQNPQTPMNKIPAFFGDITLNAGSEGSVFIGLTLSCWNCNFNIYSDNITVKNCFLSHHIVVGNSSNDKNIQNLIISGCFFSVDGGINYSWNYTGILVNFVFKNNIVNGGYYLPNGSNGIISNNIFLNDKFQPGLSSNFQIINNICMSDSDDDFIMQSPSASISHNISAADFFGDENGNISWQTAVNLFIGAANTNIKYSTDGYYQLNPTANNPAIGGANDGGDIGAFGGPESYQLSGVPDIPIIFEINTGGIVSGDKVPVHIKIRQ
jgi:hypothetical protein